MKDDLDDILADIDEKSDYSNEPQEPEKKEKKEVLPDDASKLARKLDIIDEFDDITLENPSDSTVETKTGIVKKEDDAAEELPEINIEIPQKEQSDIKNHEDIPAFFTIRGTRSWNIREPYIIRIQNDKLQRDYANLTKSFYYHDSSTKESLVQREIREAIVKYYRGSAAGIVSEYGEFIFKMLFSQASEILGFFNVGTEKQKQFIYHVGALTMYYIIINYLQTLKYGYCIKLVEQEKMVKYIPNDFIKERVLLWFQENINSFDIQFDSTNEFDEAKKAVSKKYYTEVDRINTKVDLMIKLSKLDSNKSFNKSVFYKSKVNELFGIGNIIVYKRFVEKTILNNSLFRVGIRNFLN